MSLEEHSAELSLAVLAAQQAGDVLMDFQERGFTMREKAENDLVSEADFAAEKVVLDAIRETFPHHTILSEETCPKLESDDIPEHLWIVDPLDGTTNYAHGLPHFAVSIAYACRGRTHCGVVYNPARNDWYVAARGAGAWYNDARMIVSQQNLSESLVGVGFYYDRDVLMEATLATIHGLFKSKIHGIRRLGTASLDLANVARGIFGAYFEYQLSPWDFAAGRLLVDEAGGRCSNAFGGDLPLTKTSILATNGMIHREVLEIIHQSAGHLLNPTKPR